MILSDKIHHLNKFSKLEKLGKLNCATHRGLLCLHVQYMILTHTGVGSHSPGEGANLSGILGPPQALQLSKFTSRTDECAQAL